MLHQFVTSTHTHREFVDVTARVQELVRQSRIADGMCLVYSPHTSAGVTINENADPDVLSDLLSYVEERSRAYRL